MIIEAVICKEELDKALRYYFLRRDRVSRLFSVFLIALILALFNFGEPKFVWLLFFIKLSGIFILVYFIKFFLPLLIFKNRWKEVLMNNDIKIKYETFTDGIKINSDFENDLVTWPFIKHIFSNKEFIFIETKTRKIYIIPSKFFSSNKDAGYFLSLINNKIYENSYTLNEKKGIQLYKFGWFGLIPIFGFFVGLFLAYKGFFKYKNNTLKVIGFGGILFNLLIFGFTFYQIKFTNKTQDGDYYISGQQLNMVVKDIELYKALYSVYPDNLEELLKVDNAPPITDPFLQDIISPFDTLTNIYFHYKKIGNNYILYSVGRDHIPNTKDDIYPTMIDSLNINTGLIKLKK